MNQACKQGVVDANCEYIDEHHLRGKMLSSNQQVYHVKVVCTFLKAHVPLSKVDLVCVLLEETTLRLTNR